ncbi:hypothetical protein [Streptomyces vietnamensis]|uniref:Uncharacterized protein n=1 Tax=Streptomyces vietnamensis TaxID=362257 RepID=A0A0B5IL95_9ACTN|nr:hypothetical protein [Streptomyces vietnamensis]AJF69164.1 hypothetical protein SVTN_37645 [Streptomyces vietnamensis]
MPDIEKHIAEIWTLYGRHQLTRTFNLPELDDWAWDVPGSAPASTCSAPSSACASRTSGPGPVGTPPTWQHSVPTSPPSTPPPPSTGAPSPATPGLRLVCAGAVDHLREAPPYDLIHSVGGVPLTIDSPQADQPLSYRLRTATSGRSPGPRPARGPQSTPPDRLRVGLVASTGSA